MALFHFPSPRSPVSWANNLLSFFFSSWQQRLRRRYLFPWSLPSDQRPSIFPFSHSVSLVCGSPPSSVFRLTPSSRSHFCTTPFFADIVIIFLFFLLCQKGNRVLGNRVHSHRKTGGGGGFDRSPFPAFLSLLFFATAADSPESQNIPNLLSPLLAGKGVLWPESSSRGVVGSGERLEGFATRSLGRKEEKGSGRKPGLAPLPLLPPNPLYAQTQRNEQGGRRDLSDTRFNIGQYFFLKKNLVGNMRGRRFQMSSCSVKIPILL